MQKPLSKTKIKSLNKEFSENISGDFDLIYLLQSIDDPINVGSFFRLADATNASLILTGTTPIPPKSGISLTARGLERSVPWTYFENFEDAIKELKEREFDIVGVELTENAVAYNSYDYKKKTCLVLGNEKIGIFKKNLDLCNKIVFIPMLGKGPSLNVNMAAGIVGYEVIQKTN